MILKMNTLWSEEMVALRDRYKTSQETAIRARSRYYQREEEIADEIEESNYYYLSLIGVG